MPHGTVHYWFADKADLLRGVMDTMLTDVRATIVGDASGHTLDGRLTRIHEDFVDMQMGRQLALLEFTLAAARTPSLRPLAQELYGVYASAARETLQPWEDRVDEVLPGGAPALAHLITAVIDGLTLAGLTSENTRELAAARDLFLHLLGRALDDGAPARN